MWNELWEQHRGRTIGVIGGVFFGFIYLIWGFWDMLIFAFIVIVGYYIGKKIDRREEVIPMQNIWHYLSQKWRMFR